MSIIEAIAEELHIQTKQAEAVLSLLSEGATVPFIARYRKEMTGALDEEAIRIIAEKHQYQLHLAKRKEDVLRLIETQGKLNEALKEEVMACTKLSQVEDIYRPFKQKKKTRAGIAIAAGLQPVAEHLLACPLKIDHALLKAHICEAFASEEAVLQGAMDIIAEKIAEDQKVRNKIYDSMMRYGKLVSIKKKQAEDEAKIYRMYYAYEERISTLAPHRIMAIDRGEKEKVLQVSLSFDEDYLLDWTKRRIFRKQMGEASEPVEKAMQDGLKRLAFPSIERMVRSELSAKAQEASIDVFSMNLEKLLLQPPMKEKTILGLDPAFRTGCKLAVIDKSGKVLAIDVIYPHQPNAKLAQAKQKIIQLCQDHHVDLIAIGNGTASRESEAFIASLIQEAHLDVAYTIVSEAGASVYSASKQAISEFPDLHVEQRSAISIARRLLDPLSELIKIDPRSIGVGQYQHDLPDARLKERLDFVVDKCVNLVGVNVNTAGETLLKHVAGLSGAMAKQIVAYREQHGKIKERAELAKVKGIGPKAFEQAAGFLRIENGRHPFDRTAIHPESYALANTLLRKLHLEAGDIGTEHAKAILETADPAKLCDELHCDRYTLQDILDACKAPLRDYRDQNDGPLLRTDILTMEDLQIGDALEGVVRNVVDFGAFVDIGLKEDGLIHISQLSDKRIQHPSEVVSVGDLLKVWVYRIDEEKHKVQLTLRQRPN